MSFVELVGNAFIVLGPLSLAAYRHTPGGKLLMAYCSLLLHYVHYVTVCALSNVFAS